MLQRGNIGCFQLYLAECLEMTLMFSLSLST